MVSEPLELKVKREENVPSYDHGEMQTWSKEKPTLGIGSYQKNSSLVDSNNSALTNSQVPGPFSIIPCPEYMSCASPFVSTRRKPPRGITHIPIAVQALPCFPASEMTNSRGRKPKGSIQNSTIARNKLQSDGDLNSHSRVGIQLSTCQNGFHQDPSSDSNSSTQFKHSSESSLYENSESCPSRKIPKLRNEVSCSPMLPTGTRENGKLEESSEGVSWPRTKEFSFSKSFNQSPEKFSSSSQVKESRKQRYGSSHGANTKKILGFPISEKLQQDVIGTNSAGDMKTSIKTEGCDVGTVTAKGIRQNIIDLNVLNISTEDEVPSITGKTVHEIDLEVPIPSYETLDMVAAENLLVMSLGLSQQLASASCNSLHWFADLVSSKTAKADYDDDNGEDVFESSTLKLEEMKPDECLPLPQEQESQNDETSPGASSLLLTKTLRGQARKRRQRKDFQKDILPGLVSLSRHEVTEDLQAFDCLMRAMGEDWQCNLTRRKGSGGQGRRRSRPRNSSVAITDNCSSPPPPEAVPNPKVEINERSILGWGRTTRRGRRPRVKPGNASLVVS